MATNQDPRTKPLKRINTRKETTVDESGNIVAADITCWLDPRGTPRFVYLLPDYVGDALEIKGGICAAPTAAEALTAYNDALKRYQDHARSAHAEAMIAIRMEYAGRDEEGRGIGHERYGQNYNDPSVRVSYELIF